MSRTLPAAWLPLQRSLIQDVTTHRSELRSLISRCSIEVAEADDIVAALAAGEGARELVAHAIAEHRSGRRVATAALLLSRLPMLVSVSRHAHVDQADFGTRFDVQRQAAVTAFLTVLEDVDLDDEYLVHSLYWKSLHSVTDRRHHLEVTTYPDMAVFENSYRTVEDSVTCGTIMDDLLALYAVTTGKGISSRDEATLRAMFARPHSATVAEVAEEIGISEHAFESRLRRAVTRLRAGLPAGTRDSLLLAA